jgi:hypothetical protein
VEFDMNRSITTFIVLASLVSVPTISFATTPTISNVSGTISSGQSLTISGANLMDENKAYWVTSPVNFASGSGYGFEGASPKADCYGSGCSGFDTGGGGSSAGYSTTVKLSGNQSANFHIQGQHTPDIDHNPRAGSHVWFDNPLNDYYVRGYVRYDLKGGTWPTGYIKMFMGGYFFQPNSGSNLPSQMLTLWGDSDGDLRYSNIPNGQMEYGRWYCVEAHRKGTSPGIIETWMDGKQLVSVTTTNGGSTNAPEFGIINLDGTTSAFILDHYVDNYAISRTSRIHCSSSIEIGNSSDYAAATKKYQAPLFLSDGSVQIKADLSGLGSGPYYLWVTNNRQERSQAYPLAGGGSGLSAPTNLRIQ